MHFALRVPHPLVAAAGITGRHRPCFIDSKGSAVKFLAAEFGNGLLGALVHLHKAKPFGAASFAIGDDADRVHMSGLREQFLDFSFGRLKR